MSKRIAISSMWQAPMQEELLAKIRAVAPDYELLDISPQAQPTDAQLAECEILFGSAQSQVRQKMTNLKWIHTQSAGVDGILNPTNNLPEHILLTNSSGAYGISIGEHMLMVTLMLLRNAAAYVLLQQDRGWQRIGVAENLYNCRVAVIGLGDIGGRYAYLCHSMGASVCGVVRTPRAEKPPYVSELFTTVDIGKAVHDADIVALALPGTVDTYGILSRELFAKMKKGALIVNVGRGNAIDQGALIEFLQNRHLGGAALDVTTPEPLPPDNPLWDIPNVIITPHISNGGRYNTTGLIVEKFVRYLGDYIAGRPFERVVDRDAGY